MRKLVSCFYWYTYINMNEFVIRKRIFKVRRLIITIQLLFTHDNLIEEQEEDLCYSYLV